MVKEDYEVRLGKTKPLVVGNTAFISSNDCDLTEKELEKARIELGETEESRKECLQELRNKLSEEGNYRTDDEFLLRFLRVRKFDTKKAYDNVKNFYQMRNKHFDFFGHPSKIKNFKNFKFISVLPYADEEGRLMLWADTEHWHPQVMPFEEFVQPLFATCDVATINPKFQIHGVIGIWDMKGVGFRELGELLKYNRCLSFVSIAHSTYPWRIKKVLVVNTSRFSRIIYNLVRPLLTKKLTERVFLLGSDPSELHEHIDPAVLPKKLGGKLEDDICRRPELILDNIKYLEYDRSFTGDVYN